MIEHYESAECGRRLRRRDYIITPSTTAVLETTPLLPSNVSQLPTLPPFIASEQAWNRHTQRFQCYLCNPVKLGFHTLAGLNEHLADVDHQARRYKCPQLACNLPFKSIEGLVQHIELRSCRCMIDSTWWNSYFTIHDALEGGSAVTEIGTPTTFPEIDLEEYWIRRYFEMTGSDGRWIYRRALFSGIANPLRGTGTQLRVIGRKVGDLLSRAASVSIAVLRILIPPVLFIVVTASLTTGIFFLLRFIYFGIVPFFQWLIPVLISFPGLFVECLVQVIAFLILLVFRIIAGVINIICAIIDGIFEFIGRVLQAIIDGW